MLKQATVINFVQRSKMTGTEKEVKEFEKSKALIINCIQGQYAQFFKSGMVQEAAIPKDFHDRVGLCNLPKSHKEAILTRFIKGE